MNVVCSAEVSRELPRNWPEIPLGIVLRWGNEVSFEIPAPGISWVLLVEVSVGIIEPLSTPVFTTTSSVVVLPVWFVFVAEEGEPSTSSLFAWGLPAEFGDALLLPLVPG